MINTKLQATELLLSCLPQDIRTLQTIFSLNGHDIFLVGGCIRDSFLNEKPKDFDICTNALPDTIIEMLQLANIKCQLQGQDFGIVVAMMSEPIEIATFRTDVIENFTGNNKDTKVKVGATIEEDVNRRDITINGLFLNLNTNEIIDLVNGIEDLENGIIRCIGNPTERFAEDSLRKLRVVRFASRLKFEIHEDTLKAIQNDPSLNISKERIVNEFTTTFQKAKTLFDLIFFLHETKLIFEIFKGLEIKPDFETVDMLDLDKEESLSTFIAMIIDEFTENPGDKLFELGFPTKLCKSIDMLFEMMHTDMHPLDFIKKLPSTDLTKFDIISFFGFFNTDKQSQIKFLCNFSWDKQKTQELIAQGFQGKALGDKIRSIVDDMITNNLIN